MNESVLSMCVTATAAAMAKRTNSATAREALPDALRPHSGRLASLRQHPLHEVQALLSLGELTLQLADFEFQRLELRLHPFGRVGPGPELPSASAGTRSYALRPKTEP